MRSTPLIPSTKVERNLKCEMVTIQLVEHECWYALFHFKFRSIFGQTCRPPAKNWALLKSMRSQTAKAGEKMSVPDFGSYTDPGKYNATRS